MAKGPPATSDARRLFQRLKREKLLRLAYLRNGEDDEGRARAIRTLHRLYRRQLARWRLVVDAASLAAFADEEGFLPLSSPPIRPSSREARTAIVDRQLDDLFKGLGECITRAENPIDAARILFEPSKKRGRKRVRENEDNKFDIVVTIYKDARIEYFKKIKLCADTDDAKDKLWRQCLADAMESATDTTGYSLTYIRKIVADQREKWSEAGLLAGVAFMLETRPARPVEKSNT